MPKRNPETSYCEIRRVQRDRSGAAKTIKIVAVVRSVARAEAAVDRFERELTKEEKEAGISHYWAYTSRQVGRGWR